MAEFHIVGDTQPFLLAKMGKNDKIFAESNAMVSMESCINLQGKMSGGLLSALGRKMFNDESFFLQQFDTQDKGGDVLLAPQLPGALKILDCGGNKQYYLNDGAYLASEAGIQITAKTQKLSVALFGGSGGFVVMKTEGQGKVVVSSFGEILELNITKDSPMIVDNGHVVAWDCSLQYDVSVSTSKGGFFSRALNSMTSGEGVVNRFSGEGKVYIASRNSSAFLSWIMASMPVRTSNN